MTTGWTCPSCSRAWAPWVASCNCHEIGTASGGCPECGTLGAHLCVAPRIAAPAVRRLILRVQADGTIGLADSGEQAGGPRC
jgi:hypothetical protein